MNTPRLPDDTKRTLFVGRTGSGKSQRALYLLSLQNWHEMPWVIIDYKGEDLVQDIRKQNKGKIPEIKVSAKPPKTPGLYYMRPNPKLDDDAMEAWLMEVWKRGDIGLFIDEGYALPDMGRTDAFTLILTQGRSKHIPCIYLYQRPVYMSRFATAQADFICVFKQGDNRDEKITSQYCKPTYLPNGQKVGPEAMDTLPDYYSLWHDVGRGTTSLLAPAPQRAEILLRYKQRLSPPSQRSFV